jgi:RNA polymerase sigma factor (sigma-70 family)
MLLPDKFPSQSTFSALDGWEMLRQGEKKGLAIIYNAHVQDMYRVGMAIRPNSSFVQDCIHEVFENLWKYHTGLKSTDNVKLYLLRSVSNKIHRDMAGTVGRIHASPVNDFEEQFSVDSYEFELVREQGDQEIRRKLTEAYEKLPLRQKEVIHLLFFESLTYEETSSVMDLHLKSVYNLACKAISNLRKSMAIIVFFCIQ